MNQQQQIEMARQIRERSFAQVDGSVLAPPHLPAAQREQIRIPTSLVDARANVYRPLEQEVPLPVFINLHGGGFIMGAPEMDDPWCALIAERTGCVVVNVDYVLAPEHKFPAPVYQCYEIAQWVYQHADQLGIDPQRMAIGGHSAGGNLSAAVCILNRERGDELPIRYQILDYPPLDLATDPGDKPDFAEAIPAEMARTFNAMYIDHVDDARDRLASPVWAADEALQGLPPALVITAGKDSLAAEAKKYAQRLQAAGVPVLYRDYPGEAHGFTHNGTAANSLEAWELMADQLQAAFAK
ncbi:alpha/beta hydrolase [Paenibacillus campi]|uniref:alpha/beta hydrolase n=1 Tax=Paenibacillus campi TaxID=3106031 RepID=UPI002B003361|nr:alpha/beta hydrolase [Paenibacillus sp. SGZ-1009]